MRLVFGGAALLLCVGCDPAVGVESEAGSSSGTSTTTSQPPQMTSDSAVTTAQPTTATGVPPNPSTTAPPTATDPTVGDGSDSSGFEGSTSWGSTGGGSTGGSSTSGGSTGGGSSGSTGGFGCGNEVIDPGEQCDGENLQGFDCASLGLGGGELSCEPQCVFDVSDCGGDPDPADCLDGVVQPGEQCDGLDLQGLSCAALGLGDGALACSLDCTFDTSGCDLGMGCGNGMVELGEQCDGDDLQGLDCPSLGLGGGVLACDPVLCIFDTSGCEPE